MLAGIAWPWTGARGRAGRGAADAAAERCRSSCREDEQDADAWVAAHPERQEVRIAVGVLRDGVARLRAAAAREGQGRRGALRPRPRAEPGPGARGDAARLRARAWRPRTLTASPLTPGGVHTPQVDAGPACRPSSHGRTSSGRSGRRPNSSTPQRAGPAARKHTPHTTQARLPRADPWRTQARCPHKHRPARRRPGSTRSPGLLSSHGLPGASCVLPQHSGGVLPSRMSASAFSAS